MSPGRPLTITFLFFFITGCPIRHERPPEPAIAVGGPSVPPPPSPDTDPFAQPDVDHAALREACPVLVPGATVSVEELEHGAALTFGTRSGDVLDLRRRVHALAWLYASYTDDHWLVWHVVDPNDPTTRVTWGGVLPGVDAADEQGPVAVEALHGPLPPVHPQVREHPRGAVLVLTADDPLQAYHVREQVLLHALYLEHDRCPVLHRAPTAAES